MQGIYTYIPETNYAPREYSVAAILLLLCMVFISSVIIIIIIINSYDVLIIHFNKKFVEFLFAFVVSCLLPFVTCACSL